MKHSFISIMVLLSAIILNSCENGTNDKQETKSSTKFTGAKGEVKLITLDPGHFHAALVQKNMYDQINSEVFVYAPKGNDVDEHVKRVLDYNARMEKPTTWFEKVYRGSDYLEKMVSEKKGNVVVVSGNNRFKADYIKKSVEAGFNVLADNPMVITPEQFPLLEEAFR